MTDDLRSLRVRADRDGVSCIKNTQRGVGSKRPDTRRGARQAYAARTLCEAIIGKRSAAGGNYSNVHRIASVEADRPDLPGREHAIDNAEFERIARASGGAQPYMRLLWLCGLTVGKGNLLPGYALNRKYTLTKWPQIEREYPKHFRIATAMMKGPATLDEVAAASGKK